MTGYLNSVPGIEVRENLPFGLLQLALNLGDFRMNIEAKRIGVGVLLQLIQLCLQFGDGLFEVELMFHT